MNILILGNPNVDFTRKLVVAGEERGHQMTVISPHSFTCQITKNSQKDDYILYFDEETQQHIWVHPLAFDFVINRVAGANFNIGLAITKEFEKMEVPVLNSSQSIVNCSDKFFTHQLLSEAFLPNPVTLFASHSSYELMVKQLGSPFVVKRRRGSQGKSVFKIDNIDEGRRFFGKDTDQYIFQEYLDNAKNGHSTDIRAVVIGNDDTGREVVASYQRISQKNDFKANYSISKTGKPIKLTDYEEHIAIHASKAMGTSFNGVDIMRYANRSFIIETNSNAGLTGITKVTEVNVAQKVIEFIELQKLLLPFIDKETRNSKIKRLAKNIRKGYNS